MANRHTELQQLLESAVAALNYEFVGFEFRSQGRHSLLRVYIDKPDGISVEDCEEVSRQISSVLDVEEPIKTEYTLEVSSPGLDRPIFTLAQMQQFVGHMVRVKLATGLAGRRNFCGKLVTVIDNDIVLLVDQQEFTLPYVDVEKANLEPEW